MSTKLQQKQLRRHSQAHDKIKSLFTVAKLDNALSFDAFINMDTPAYDALAEVIKLAKKHRKITLDLLAKRLISNDEVVEEHTVVANETLYNELKSRYDPTKTATKQIKHENSSTEKFTNIIFNDNLDLMRFHIAGDAQLAIQTLKDDIDLSNYEPKSIHYKRNDNKHMNAIKAVLEASDKKEEPVARPLEPKPKPKPKPPIDEDDSDIEEFIARLDKDKDNVSKTDLHEYKLKLKKKWKTDINEELSNYDGEEEEDWLNDIIDTYVGRSKRTRGIHADIEEWGSRNPESLKKCVAAVVKTLYNKI